MYFSCISCKLSYTCLAPHHTYTHAHWRVHHFVLLMCACIYVKRRRVVHVYASTFLCVSLAFVYMSTESTMRRILCMPLEHFPARFNTFATMALNNKRLSRLPIHLFGCDLVCGTVFWFSEGEKPFCDVTNILMNIFRYVIADSVYWDFFL